MKYIKGYKIFEKNDTTFKLDEILDKIGSNGIQSLSDDEKTFLNSFKSGKQEEVYQDLSRRVYEEGYFKFVVDHVEDTGESVKVYGILTINGGKELQGSFIRLNNGMNDMDFDLEDGKTVFDYTEGFEQEFDNFMSSVLDQEEL